MPRPPTTGPASRGFLRLCLHVDEQLAPQPLRWSQLVSQSGILSRFSGTFDEVGRFPACTDQEFPGKRKRLCRVAAPHHRKCGGVPGTACLFFTTSRQRAKSTAGTGRIGHGGATHQTANLCSKLNCASLPRPQGRAGRACSSNRIWRTTGYRCGTGPFPQ